MTHVGHFRAHSIDTLSSKRQPCAGGVMVRLTRWLESDPDQDPVRIAELVAQLLGGALYTTTRNKDVLR